MTSQGQKLFRRDVAARLSANGLTISSIARKSGVHQSQVSRILAGKFTTVSSNVMQICMTLGLKVDDYLMPVVPSNADRERIQEAALSAWDGSPEDARALSSLLRTLSGFRR
ncbi:helix-turn-helix domain-containing protein [Bradyrhizobium sp. CCBAU 53421]|uniref:helix-turn-helix domain-containing protein n=1 Tax=Bradyrhizobium sp. CCBAU 53421 TaxID=1325120 RepID=UPI0035304C90